MAKKQSVVLADLLADKPEVEVKAEDVELARKSQLPELTGDEAKTVSEWIADKDRATQLVIDMKATEEKTIIPLIQKRGLHHKPEAPDSAIAKLNEFKLTVVSKTNWYYTEAPGLALLKLGAEFKSAQKAEKKKIIETAHELINKIMGGGFEKEHKKPKSGYKEVLDDEEMTALLEQLSELENQLVVIKEDLDWAVWEAMFNSNQLPPELVSAVAHRGDPSLYVLVKATVDRTCKKCAEPVGKSDKFCKHCGTPQ